MHVARHLARPAPDEKDLHVLLRELVEQALDCVVVVVPLERLAVHVVPLVPELRLAVRAHRGGNRVVARRIAREGLVIGVRHAAAAHFTVCSFEFIRSPSWRAGYRSTGAPCTR